MVFNGIDFDTYFKNYPTNDGFFGKYGGAYVSEDLKRAMDEITKDSDCVALRKAAWCGVRLIATAHAADMDELNRRLLYKPMMRDGIFDTLIVLNKDKTWRAERV